MPESKKVHRLLLSSFQTKFDSYFSQTKHPSSNAYGPQNP